MNLYHTSSFQQEVLASKVPVLVDFWAPWCGPCKRLEPVIEEIAVDLKGKIRVGKVDIAESKELAQKYGIMSIPAIFLFKNGKPVFQLSGYQSKTRIMAQIQRHL